MPELIDPLSLVMSISPPQTCPVAVTMEMTLHQIVELDEKHELLTTSVWQRLVSVSRDTMWLSP